MQITSADLATLTFELTQNTTVTERVFSVINTVNGVDEAHVVLVSINKKQNDSDGDGTIDTLDAKFTLSLVNNDGSPVLVNNQPIKITQVHSLNIVAVVDQTVVVNWISDKCIELIPMLINKKTALATWGAI
jgi:hypothetical protein